MSGCVMAGKIKNGKTTIIPQWLAEYYKAAYEHDHKTLIEILKMNDHATMHVVTESMISAPLMCDYIKECVLDDTIIDDCPDCGGVTINGRCQSPAAHNGGVN